MSGAAVGIGPCWLCGRHFEFDLDTVPSVMIDPVTNRPADVAADGTRVAPDPDAVARSTKQALCPQCVCGINRRRVELGMEPAWPVSEP